MAKSTDHDHDRIVRGTAAGGMIRALAIDSTSTVREAQRRHTATPLATNALGRLLMAAQMMGSLFKVPGERLSLMVRCDGALGGLTVTADNEGNARGYAVNPQVTGTDVPGVVGAGTLVVVRESPHVEPYVSQIPLANGTIADDLTAYYILSEQIPTLMGLEVLFDGAGAVARAGGYFVQLMPGYTNEQLTQMERALASATPLGEMLAADLSSSAMLQQLLGPLGYQEYEVTEAAWRCDCSKERSERTLLSLGIAELQSMVDEGEPVTITCDFCNAVYEFAPSDLECLLRSLQ